MFSLLSKEGRLGNIPCRPLLYAQTKRASFRPMPEEALFVCAIFYRSPQRTLATNCIILHSIASFCIQLHHSARNDAIERQGTERFCPASSFQCALISSIARVLWQADSTRSFDTSMGTMEPSADARNKSSWPFPRIRQRFFVTARFFKKLIQALL